MKFSLSVLLMIISLNAFSEGKLSLYDCNRNQNNRFGLLIQRHHELQTKVNLNPRISTYDQEQRLRASGSCSAFEALLNSEIQEMQSRAQNSTYQDRRLPDPNNRRYQPQRVEPRNEEQYYEEQEERAPDTRQRTSPGRSTQRPQSEDRRPESNSGSSRNEVPRVEGGILIVTDERDAQAARAVKDSFESTPPFSCLNLRIEVYKAPSEFKCNPRSGSNARLIRCDDKANRKAHEYKGKAKARYVIVVGDTHLRGGKGGTSPTTVTSGIILGDGPLAGIHEFMHLLGFKDEYAKGQEYAPTSGDIMECTAYGCDVSRDKWSKIARGLGKTLPANCN